MEDRWAMSVANYAGSDSFHHQMHLLNEDDSWNLLHEKVCAQENWPPELEVVGSRIAYNCKGLPLAIHVIGGVLSQAPRTQEYWMQVGKNVASVVANNDEQFSKILSLSYNHLPNHLKPCFLYMSAFPEDPDIQSSRLIRLWVAEGFLEPLPNKSLGEAAEMYLKALADRNLTFTRRQEIKGTVKSYGIHDLMRDLCVRKASEEKFFCIINSPDSKLPEDSNSVRRASIHSSSASIKAIPLARSFRWIRLGAWGEILSTVFFSSRLLRVLDIVAIWLDKFPEEILRLINLRYLAVDCSSCSLLPSSISTLWNLQTIIVKTVLIHWSIEAIHGLLGIPQLRHLKFKGTYPSYYYVPGGKTPVLQENLQTLSGITVYPGFDRIIGTAPNLKKLGIVCFLKPALNIDLACLCKQETLKCAAHVLRVGGSVLPSLIFPPSLKKLTLYGCEIRLGFMNGIGSLPNVEVLKLNLTILESSSWEPAEFSRLRFLLNV